MMMKTPARIYYPVVFLLLLLASCEENPTLRDTPEDFQWANDSCGNYYPPWSWLGLHTGYPYLIRSEVVNGRLSPDGRYLAFHGRNSDYGIHGHDFPVDGMAIMHVDSRSIVFFDRLGGEYKWDVNSSKLYFISGGVINSLDPESMERRRYTTVGQRFRRLRICPSGKSIFLTGEKTGTPEVGIVRWDPMLDTAEFIVNDKELNNSFLPVNDSVLCAISVKHDDFLGLVYVNANARSKHRVEVPAFGQLDYSDFRVLDNSDMSPDGERILFEASVDFLVNMGYVRTGVLMLNRTTLEIRQVLPWHRDIRARRWYPKWSSNSRFIASWTCNNDSTRSLYEYDLNGSPVRRFTDRYTRFWEVK